MSTVAAPVGSPSPRRERHVSPARGQYALLMVVLVVTGAFAGALTFNEVLGEWWVTGVHRCQSVAPAATGDETGTLEQQRRVLACSAPFEHRRALAAALAGAGLLAVALLLTWLLPRRLMRRLGALRSPPEAWTAAVQRIAGPAGPGNHPVVMLGPPELVEPFSVHHRGRAQVVVPAGARRLPAHLVEAMLRHELAHIAAGDVRLVWLTRSLRWALPIVAVLPLGLVAVRASIDAGRSLTGSLLQTVHLEYLVRLGVLLVAAWLLAARIGRAREHEADARAAAGGALQGLEALLRRGRADRPSPARRLAAWHPSPADRIAFLRRAAGPAPFGRLDEVIAGALAAIVLFASYQVTTPALTGTPLAGWAIAVDSFFAGLLLATTCGTARWRRPGQHRVRPPAMLLGVPVGLLAGVGHTGTSGGPYGTWWTVLTLPVALAGAAAICAAIAAGLPVDGRTPGWVSVVPGVAVFTLACWLGAAWGVFLAALRPEAYLFAAARAPWGWLLAAAVLAGCALARRIRHTAGLSPARVAASVIAAAATAGTIRLLMVAPVEQHVVGAARLLDIWSAAAAGLAVLMALLLVAGSDGLLPALSTAPVATVLAGSAIYARWFGAFADPLTAAGDYCRESLMVLGTGILVLAAASALHHSRPRPRTGRRAALRRWPGAAPLTSALVAAALTAALIGNAGLLTYG